MTLFEVDEAANRIREEVDPDANIIFGSTFDERLAGKMRISVVATGIDAESVPLPQPIPTLAVRSAAAAEAAPPRPAGPGYTQPLLRQNAVAGAPLRTEPTAPAGPEVRTGEPAEAALPAAAEAAESAALRNGAFVAPRPANGSAAPQPATAAPAVARETAVRPKARAPSLIERVTGIGRARATPPAPPVVDRPQRAPTPIQAKVSQPRLAPLEPEDRPAGSKEDDLLDIPAFLRRQAN
jgi:cell division protein FtsZ